MKPIKKGSSVLGLDISSDFIKIAELELTQEGVKINSFGSTKTPPESIKEGVIVNPKSVADAISALLSKNGIQTKNVIASARSPHALLRLSRLPFMSEEQLRVALQREIAQYTVFKGKDPKFDTHIVEEMTEAGARKINVLFAVISKKLCDSYLKTLELAGLDLTSIDISTLAILRSLSGTTLKTSGMRATMLVSVNQEGIDMCILKGEKIRFCHTIKIDTGQVAKDADGFVDKIVSAFKLVLNFYQAKYAGGEEISRMVLTCDSYPCLTLKEKLGQILKDVNIEIGNPAGNIKINENRISPDKAKQLSSFTCAMGCALQVEWLSSYPVRLNLIPRERFEKAELTKATRFLNIMLGTTLAIFLVLIATLFTNNKVLQHKDYELRQELEKRNPLLMKVNSIFNEREEVEKLIESRLMFLSAVSFATVPWDSILINALAKVPKGLWVVRIISEGNNIRIAGRASSEEPIYKFIKSMNNSFYFISAKLIASQNMQVEDREELEFLIGCDLRFEE